MDSLLDSASKYFIIIIICSRVKLSITLIGSADSQSCNNGIGIGSEDVVSGHPYLKVCESELKRHFGA